MIRPTLVKREIFTGIEYNMYGIVYVDSFPNAESGNFSPCEYMVWIYETHGMHSFSEYSVYNGAMDKNRLCSFLHDNGFLVRLLTLAVLLCLFS